MFTFLFTFFSKVAEVIDSKVTRESLKTKLNRKLPTYVTTKGQGGHCICFASLGSNENRTKKTGKVLYSKVHFC